MRSRDGNHSFSFSICTLILLTSLTLHAKEYFISYRYVVKDATLYNETLYVSSAMQKCQGTPQEAIILETSRKNTTLKEAIMENIDQFLTHIDKLALDVKHTEKTQNLQNSSTTILTLKTTCFKVDFNDNFVKIAPLK